MKPEVRLGDAQSSVINRNVVIPAGDMVTPYGRGIDACWQGLLSKRCMIQPVLHFTAAFEGSEAGIIPNLSLEKNDSRVMAMLRPLLNEAGESIPNDALCLLATTIGEIEYLEEAVLENKSGAEESCPSRLLKKIETALKLKQAGIVVSAACSSAGVAISQGAAMIADGEQDAVLVVACDSVSEFLYSGFSSLLALDAKKARPFDQNREGLSIGEATGYLLLMSEERAVREKRKIMGEIAGWEISNDANHMTGPSRDGLALAKAIQISLKKANIDKKSVASISAHGTGTLYNDAMELKAFKSAFENPIPAYSIKGAIGHTMAAAGLVEVLVALKSLDEQKVPATVGVSQIDAEAQGWISGEIQPARGDYALSTNSGFGGVNASLLLKRGRP